MTVYWSIQAMILHQIKEKTRTLTYDELKEYIDSEIERIKPHVHLEHEILESESEERYCDECDE